MATEPTDSPVAESQIPAAEVETPEVTAPEAEASADPPAEPADEADKALKRMQRRIDKRTADVYRTRAENEQLRQRLERLEAGSAEVPKVDDPASLAREISRIERFTEKSNELVSRGTKAHADYMDALKDLAAEVGDFVAPNGAPSKFMDVVLQVSDAPDALLYHLGKNTDLAEELADLTPIQLAKKLARIETAMTEALKPQQSKAPKPLQPVRGSGVVTKSPDQMTDAEYAKWRKGKL